MRALRCGLVALVICGLTTPALGGDLQTSATPAAQQEEKGAAATSSRAATWTGASLFVGGMAVGLYGFLNDRNGSFSEFGESTAVNKGLGAAGLSAAFAGGALLYLGHRHHKRAPSIAIGPRRLAVEKRVSW